MNKKLLKKQKMGGTVSAYDAVLEELKVLKQLEHPNVIFLREIIDDPQGDIFLVTDYYSNGSLGDIMRNLNS